MKDRDLAQQLGRPTDAVKERRRQLSIAHFYPGSRRPWTPAEEELLGTMADERLARRLKRSVETVRTRRAHRGIPVFNPKKHWWTAEDDKLLGLRPDAQVAMLLGVNEGTVRHRRNQLRISLPAPLWKVTPRKSWRAEDIAMLGKVTDAHLARRLGRSVTSVKTRRLRLGIASSLYRWAPEHDVLLGNFSDKALARRLGCTVKAVQAQRERLGIPAPTPE
jgi:DNA-binding CsgD family transcriptional regulator